MEKKIDLSIIIVSWNVKDLLKMCLDSIYKNSQNINFKIFVIDNASSDNTIQMIKEEFPLVYLIENQKNLGFAKANNEVIRFILSDPERPRACLDNHYVLLLNPDTELVDNSLEKMISFMDAHPNCGILGPKLLNPDLTLQRSCRKFPGLLDQLFIQFKFYNFFPEKIKWVREYYMLDFDHLKIREVDQVMGSAMLIRKEVFDKIGLFDEKFWSVFEEVDFCKKAKEAGFKIYFYPFCQIIHHKEQSFQQLDGLKKQINFNHSLYHYFKKHRPFWQLVILWLVQPLNLFLTWLDSAVGVRKRVGKRKDL